MKQRKYRWDTGLRIRVLGLLILLLSLLAILGMLLSDIFVRADFLQQEASRTSENVLLMEQVSGTFAEMTAALRGYLLTGEEPFLQPYNAAKARMETALQDLQARTGSDSAQQQRLRLVSELVRDWEAQVAAPEIAAKRANLSSAGDLVAQGLGLSHVEQIREAANAYIGVESDRLQSQIDSANIAARNVQRGIWIAVGVAAVIALVGFLVFARSVTYATGALAAAAEAIARGERGVVVKADLDGELQEVAEAFEAMSMTLAAQEEELAAQHEELSAQNEVLLSQQEELQNKAARLEQQDERLSRLNRVGLAMIGTIDMDQLSKLILDEYIDLFGGTAGALLLTDPYSEELTVQAQRWLSPQWRGARLPLSGPLARCVERSEVVTARYPGTLIQVKVWQTDVPVDQEIYVPLVHTDRVIAVAVIAAAEVAELPDEAMALWDGVARQAAVALTAAQNHLEVRRGLQALQEQAAQVEELNAQLEEERDRTSAQLEIYLSIVASMRAGAWLTDPSGNLLVVNATFREFFGDVAENANLNTLLSAMSGHLPDGDSFIPTIRTLFASREERAEGQIQLTSGFVLQWSSTPVGTAQGPMGRLFTFQDVTELAKLDRLKSEFVNTVSHELRTPLTSIMGYLSLVVNEQVGPLHDQQKEFLSIVMRNTQRLNNLIGDLLDVQRIESGRQPLNRKPVQLTEIVHQVAETFRVQAEQKGLTYEVVAPSEGIPLIHGDPDRLVQIASNLVSNAVKYTREGKVTVSVTHAKGAVKLIVEDTGIGIPAAEQKRIFEKFFRGANKYAREAGGTGLGLSIVKMTVEEHGAEIKLESHPGRGSRFTVSFPVLSASI